MQQILESVNYCHQHGVVHRDLKVGAHYHCIITFVSPFCSSSKGFVATTFSVPSQTDMCVTDPIKCTLMSVNMCRSTLASSQGSFPNVYILLLISCLDSAKGH